MTPTEPVRPRGVTLLSALVLFGGIFGLLVASAALLLSAALPAETAAAAAKAAGGEGVDGLLSTLSIALLLISAVQILFGLGMWTLRPWAWRVGIVLQSFSAVLGVLEVLTGEPTGLLSVAIGVAIVWYLDRPNVRVAFSAPHTGFPIVGHRLDHLLARGDREL